MVREGRKENSLLPVPPKTQRYTAGALSVHNKLVSLPSARLHCSLSCKLFPHSV